MNETCETKRTEATKTIVVVDDMETNNRLLELLLERDGYRVLTAHNGFEALKMVHDEIPDLVLLDVMMPEIDGYEVCRRLKTDEKTAAVPIIFVTVLTGSEDVEKAFDHGACDFIGKPFNNQEVLARVKTRVDRGDPKTQQRRRQRNGEARKYVPICSSCKRVRKENAPPWRQESWETPERYFGDSSDVEFTHGYCPECASKIFDGPRFKEIMAKLSTETSEFQAV